MTIIAFGVGIIIGILLRDIISYSVEEDRMEKIQEIHKEGMPKGKTQFIPSVSSKEKFDGAKNIEDFVS